MGAGKGVKHPLKAARWVSVAVDLTQQGWPDALRAAGFDAARPTVWAAEGLLMYLPEDAVRQLLVTAAALSAPGSRAAFSMVNAEAVRGAPLPFTCYSRVFGATEVLVVVGIRGERERAASTLSLPVCT